MTTANKFELDSIHASAVEVNAPVAKVEGSRDDTALARMGKKSVLKVSRCQQILPLHQN
jgi:hypothetical protein